MAKTSTVQVKDLGEAISQELSVYAREVTEAIDAAGEEAVKSLVKKTKATAPIGERGSFKKNITSTTVKRNRGSQHIWHVKAPDHRLTHLLVKGHATRDGGRTKADPFLENALNEVLPEYEKQVKEAIENGK